MADIFLKISQATLQSNRGRLLLYYHCFYIIIYYKSVLETTNSVVGIKGAVMQIEKALINNRLRVSKVF